MRHQLIITKPGADESYLKTCAMVELVGGPVTKTELINRITQAFPADQGYRIRYIKTKNIDVINEFVN